MIVEEKGLTPDGHPYMIIVMEDLGTRNGYVGVFSDSVFYKKSYNGEEDEEVSLVYNISVHGGLTYSGFLGRHIIGADNPYFFGFDCNHLDDGRIDDTEMTELVNKYLRTSSYHEKQQVINRYKLMTQMMSSFEMRDMPKTKEYVRDECFNLSKQLKEMEDNHVAV